jgi:small subunit ribosomal protein S2
MSETTAPPSAAGDTPAASTPEAPAASSQATPQASPSPAADAAISMTGQALEKTELSIRSLLEAGVHFGHQTRRWNPRMRSFIFGARNGTHILDLDQTLPAFRRGLDYIRSVTSEGGSVLFVGTKRQAASIIEAEATRAEQYYVNNRWLGGMLTNWKTVKKSIDTYKNLLEIRDNEEKRAEYSKKELARVNRQCDKYYKSLEGMKEMGRLPDAVFVIDVKKEAIAISEARRLCIPIVAVVDSNCDPRDIDFVVPGNDDALRSIDLYCKCVADACIEGERLHQDKLIEEKAAEPVAEAKSTPGGRRVVEIQQPPRRGRGGSGRTHSSGGWADKTADKAKAPAAEKPAAGPAAASESKPPADPAAAPAVAPPAAPAADAKPEGEKQS